MTKEEILQRRMAFDFQELEALKGPELDWTIQRGHPDQVWEYEMTITIPSYIDTNFSIRNTHVVRLGIPPSYPIDYPIAIMISDPIIFHPNWFEGGRWCPGLWTPTESLGQFVQRMMRTIRFDPEITNETSPANRKANSWYIHHKDSGRFPVVDKGSLPPPPPQSRFRLQ